MIPKYVFFTKGVGEGKKKLASFESALRDAGIEKFNLVNVSSIFPPNCIELTREEGLQKMSAGQICFVVMARHSSNEKGRMVTASIGVAKPRDSNRYGYLSEHHAYGQDATSASDFAEDLAASMLASCLGIPFNVDDDYDTKREIFMLSDQIVETKSITQTNTVQTDNVYTTVVAAAVFIIE